MCKTLVSVIIPAYNCEKYIKRCIVSVRSQTYQNLEIIVVNDGSTDKTGEVIAQLSKEDNRIVVIDKSNGGVSSARNIGLENAHGEYCAFCDSDDFMENDLIKRLVECIPLSDSGIDCACCGYVVESRYHKTEKVSRYPEKYVFPPSEIHDTILNDFRYRNTATPCLNSVWGKLYKRQIICDHDIRFPKDWNMGEDVNFNVQFYLVMNSLTFVNEPLYHYCTYNSHLTAKYTLGSYLFEITYRDFLEDTVCRAIGSTYYNESGYVSMIQKAETHAAKTFLSHTNKKTKEHYLREIFENKRYRDSFYSLDQRSLNDRQTKEREYIDNNDFAKWCQLMRKYSFSFQINTTKQRFINLGKKVLKYIKK